jgi:hypothetical protein
VFDDLNVDHLWMTFGKGKDLRWIPIHDTVRSLGPRSKAFYPYVMHSHVVIPCLHLLEKVKDSMAGLECV